MTGNQELDYAATAFQQGWLTAAQLDEVRRAWESSPGSSILAMLEQRYGIERSRFANLQTLAEAPVDVTGSAAEVTIAGDFAPLPSAKPSAGLAGALAGSFAMPPDSRAETQATLPSDAIPNGMTVDFTPSQAERWGNQPTLNDASGSRFGDTKETLVSDAKPGLASHVRMGQLSAGSGLTRERYTLTRLHARGGIGQVWLARDTALGREVALKELRPEQAPNESAAARFLEEAQITGQLEHPGIVPVYELKKSAEDDRPFYTMRFIRGGTLEQAIRDYHTKRRAGTATALDRAALLNAFIGACNAIDYAHSRGVIHRDLKGQNVVLGDFGEVMVLDWGLAKVIGTPDGAVPPQVAFDENDATHNPTLQGQIQGTPAYMAPEQAEGRIDDIDYRTDVYGLGAVLYEILTGQPPFTGSTTYELLHRVSHSQPPSPRSIDPSVPRALQEICAKALAKDPKDRYQTANALALDVKRWLADEPVSAYREPWMTRAQRWMKRHKSAVAAAAGFLILSSVGLSVVAMIVSGERDEARRQRKQARTAVDDMYSKVADQWLEDRLDPIQVEFLSKALAYYESFTQQDSNDPAVREERGRAYLRMGDVLRKLGRHGEAGDAYTKAIEILTRLTQADPKAVEARASLAMAQTRLAGSLAERGKYGEAEPLYRAAIGDGRIVAGERAEPSAQTQLARTIRGLAELQRVTGKPAEAEKSYLEARSLVEPLMSDRTQVEPRQELALIDDGLGLLLRESSRPVEAAQYYWKAAEVLERLLADAPTLPQFRVGLAKVYNGLGLLMKDTGKEAESESVLRKQVALNERLTEDFPDRPNYRRTLARSLINLAVVLREKGENLAAEDLYRRALAINEKLSTEFPDVVDYRRDQARCLNNIGELLGSRAQYADMISYCSRAKSLYEQLLKDAPEVASHRFALAAALVNIGQAERSSSQPKQALDSYRAASDLLGKLTAEFPANPDYLRSQASCWRNVGLALGDLKDAKGAEESFAKATSALDDLVTKKQAQPADRLVLAQVLTNRGLNQQSAQLAGAEATLRRSVAVVESLATEFPKVAEYQRTLAVANVNLGETLVATKQLAEGDAAFQRAADLYAALIKDSPRNADYLTELAVTLGDQADLRTKQNRLEDAIALQTQAVATQRSASAINPRNTPTRLALQTQLKALAETLLAKRDHSGAAKATEEFVQVVPGSVGIREAGARVLARCVTLVGQDSQVASEKRDSLAGLYADRAIALLRDAIQRGEIDLAKVQKDAVFAPLQARESFKTLTMINPVKVVSR